MSLQTTRVNCEAPTIIHHHSRISFGGFFDLSFSLLPCIEILVKTLHEETKEFLRILLTETAVKFKTSGHILKLSYHDKYR